MQALDAVRNKNFDIRVIRRNVLRKPQICVVDSCVEACSLRMTFQYQAGSYITNCKSMIFYNTKIFYYTVL